MIKDPSLYLRHMYECISRIKEYVEPGREFFFQDRKTQDAVIRNLEVIGQTVKDLSPDVLSASDPKIPWAQIAGARNVLAHRYLGVDLKLIWAIIERDLPQLEQAIVAIAASDGTALGPKTR